MDEKSNNEKEKKPFYKKTRFWMIIVGIFLGLMVGITEDNSSGTSVSNNGKEMTSHNLDMDISEIYEEFVGLSDIQIDEKLKEYEDKRIVTSIYAFETTDVWLSSKYLVKWEEYPYSIRAYFPKEEKEDLLDLNKVDKVRFSGELQEVDSRGKNGLYMEFSDSKVIRTS